MAGFPYSLYLYDDEGKHGGAQIIRDLPTLRGVFDTEIPAAMQLKREVRVCDDDDYIVFHAKDGQVVWPKLMI